MNQLEILNSLCLYDERNPQYDQDNEPLNGVPDNCYCDNCFKGKTRLAEYILTLQKQTKL